MKKTILVGFRVLALLLILGGTVYGATHKVPVIKNESPEPEVNTIILGASDSPTNSAPVASPSPSPRK